MLPRPIFTFAVVDAGTQAPIEHFSAEVLLREIYIDGSLAVDGRHAGGTVVCALRPGVDQVEFRAPDHESGVVSVSAGVPPGSTIMVELGPRSRLTRPPGPPFGRRILVRPG